MLIDNVEAIPIEVPLRQVFSGSGYRVDSRCTVITRIHTADGLVSEVYNGDNRVPGRTIAHVVEDELAPLLIGAEAVDLANFDASEAGGLTEWRRAAAMCAIHGIEMAHDEEPQISVHTCCRQCRTGPMSNASLIPSATRCGRA